MSQPSSLITGTEGTSNEQLISTDGAMSYINDSAGDITLEMPPTKENNISAEQLIQGLPSDMQSQLDPQSQASQIADMALLDAKVESVIRAVEEKSQAIMRKWDVCFVEGEMFEEACIQRLDQLIQEAQELEQALFKQKETILQRATYLTSHLNH